ncbi:uncharacterized protein L201_006777 [Kwoniella dendrophila CBS 6074]|uniref:Alpha-1,6-mannosyltransferase n=1 Tax=Kwoniella dendrophila CBS 6074 TaxID=1295534 RepID=A0AAX4K4X5_9TREE
MRLLSPSTKKYLLISTSIISTFLVLVGIRHTLENRQSTNQQKQRDHVDIDKNDKSSSDFFTPVHELIDYLSTKSLEEQQSKVEPSILILQHLPYFTPLYRASYAIHKLYSEIWGYGYELSNWSKISSDDGIVNKGQSMNKIYALHKVLKEQLEKDESDRYEWIFVTDIDTVISNPAIPIHSLLPPSSLSPEPLFLGNQDHNGFNAGVMIFKIDPIILSLLEAVIEGFETSSESDLSSNDHSLLSRAINDNPKISKHFYEIPQNWFNAYHPGQDKIQLQVHFVNHFKYKYPFTPIIRDNFKILEKAKQAFVDDDSGDGNAHSNTEYGLDLLEYSQLAQAAARE